MQNFTEYSDIVCLSIYSSGGVVAVSVGRRMARNELNINPACSINQNPDECQHRIEWRNEIFK
jgi:hypothetical protein